jgi:hypothetical protein
MDGKWRGRRRVWQRTTEKERRREEEMTLRKRIEGWEKELGDLDQKRGYCDAH